MKKIDEIAVRRQARLLLRRKEMAKAKQRRALETELGKHAGLIDDPVIKEYALRKKTEKEEAKRARTTTKRTVDVEMESESEEEEEVLVETVKNKKGGSRKSLSEKMAKMKVAPKTKAIKRK